MFPIGKVYVHRTGTGMRKLTDGASFLGARAVDSAVVTTDHGG